MLDIKKLAQKANTKMNKLGDGILVRADAIEQAADDLVSGKTDLRIPVIGFPSVNKQIKADDILRAEQELQWTQTRSILGGGALIATTIGLATKFSNWSNLWSPQALTMYGILALQYVFCKQLVLQITGAKPGDPNDPRFVEVEKVVAEVFLLAKQLQEGNHSALNKLAEYFESSEALEKFLADLKRTPIVRETPPQLFVSPDPMPNAAAFGRDEEDAAFFITEGMFDAIFNPEVPAEARQDIRKITAIFGHEYGHVRRGHITVNVLMALLGMSIFQVSDGVAAVVTVAADPIKKFLKAVLPENLRQFVDMVFDRVVGEAFYRSLGTVIRFVQRFVTRSCETAADMMSVIIVGDECALADSLDSLVAYVMWKMEQSQGQNPHTLIVVRDKKKTKKNKKKRGLLAPLHNYAADLAERRATYLPRIEALGLAVRPMLTVDWSDPGNYPKGKAPLGTVASLKRLFFVKEIKSFFTGDEFERNSLRANLAGTGVFSPYAAFGLVSAVAASVTSALIPVLMGTLGAVGTALACTAASALLIGVASGVARPLANVATWLGGKLGGPAGPIGTVLQWLQNVAKFLQLDKLAKFVKAAINYVKAVFVALDRTHPTVPTRTDMLRNKIGQGKCNKPNGCDGSCSR